MSIWVDADACPGQVKELLFRVAERRQITVTFVANQPLWVPPSDFVDMICILGWKNFAALRIVELAAPGDLVVTADVALAADVIAKGAQSIDLLGRFYTRANIGERLADRKRLDELGGRGPITSRPWEFNSPYWQEFANQVVLWAATAK